jgi:hypothetical protein
VVESAFGLLAGQEPSGLGLCLRLDIYKGPEAILMGAACVAALVLHIG